MCRMSIPLTPREQKRLARHEELVSRALSTVIELGVGSLSINRLAREAGLTPPALYRYFASKDALIAEIALRVLDELAKALYGAFTPEDPLRDPLATLHRCVDAYLAFARQSPGAFGFLSVLLSEPRVLIPDRHRADEVADAIEALLAPVVSAFSQASEQGQLSDAPPLTRALALFGAIHGTVLLKKQQRHALFEFEAEVLALDVFSALIRGWSMG